VFFALRTSCVLACPPWSSSPSTYDRVEGIWRSPSWLAITSTLPSWCGSVYVLQNVCTRATHTSGVGNGAVGIAKGQADSNPLRGVGLRAHLWRGSRRSSARSCSKRGNMDMMFVREVEGGGAAGRVSVNASGVRLYSCLRNFNVQRKSSRHAQTHGPV
jgi:hypothetical protein